MFTTLNDFATDRNDLIIVHELSVRSLIENPANRVTELIESRHLLEIIIYIKYIVICKPEIINRRP